MNVYGAWWNTTLTIYNKFQDPQTQVIRWYRHVVENAFWQPLGSKITIGKVVLQTDDIICRIRKDDAFREKHEWVAIPNDQMGNYFTLGQGDIIVKGEVTDEINEYVSGSRSSDLLSKYKKLQGCMEIKSWSNNTGGGRGNEHYFVKGV